MSTKGLCDQLFSLESVDIILKNSYYINIQKTNKKGEQMFADITINEQERAFQEQKAALDLQRKSLTQAKRMDSKFDKLVNDLKEIFDYKPVYKEILKNMFGFKEEAQTATKTGKTKNIYDPKEEDILSTTKEINKDTLETVEVIDNIEEKSLIENIKYTEENTETAIEKLEADLLLQNNKKELIEKLKADLLLQNNKKELENYKATISKQTIIDIWNSCSIIEKNSIKMIASVEKKNGIKGTLGHSLQYIDPETKIKYNGRFLGFYLHGKIITDENKRAIVIEGKGIIVNKKDIRGITLKDSNIATRDEIEKLEFILSQPKPKSYNNNSLDKEISQDLPKDTNYSNNIKANLCSV